MLNAVCTKKSDDDLFYVFTHGVGSSHRVFDFIVPLIKRGTCITFDLPGHGTGSSLSSKITTLDDAITEIVERWASFFILLVLICYRFIGSSSNLVLVGHSLGGYASLRFAVRNPQRVSMLVLLATGPGFRNPKSMAKFNETYKVLSFACRFFRSRRNF